MEILFGNKEWSWEVKWEWDTELFQTEYQVFFLFRECPKTPQDVDMWDLVHVRQQNCSGLESSRFRDCYSWKTWWTCRLFWFHLRSWCLTLWSLVCRSISLLSWEVSTVKVWGWLSTVCSYPSGPSLCNTWTFWVGKCCKSHTDIYGLQWAADLSLLFQLELSPWCLPRLLEHKRVVSSIYCSNRQLKD